MKNIFLKSVFIELFFHQHSHVQYIVEQYIDEITRKGFLSAVIETETFQEVIFISYFSLFLFF